ncbi:MAG: ParB/RepB/Spo0J family partition protein [Erysipelotrichaceae bacterium]|nr:ParB/RepB/Spo0J family partition protein [Erysipelotrichaceae bacterium]
MATKKKEHLGTGLSAIFGDDIVNVINDIENSANDDGSGRKVTLRLNEIRTNPYQPRKVFNDEKINELAESIRQSGVFTPILVRQSVGGYELISGERRLRASELAGKDTIPAIIIEATDDQMMEISLLENIQRENLNAIEEANAYQTLMKKMDCTQEQLAARIGKSREHIANIVRLLKLPKDVQKLVEDGKLSMGHVRPLITLDKDTCSRLANKAVSEGLSVRTVEALSHLTPGGKARPETPKKDPFIRDLEKRLKEKYETPVKITDKSINISYSDTEDLNRILEILGMIE